MRWLFLWHEGSICPVTRKQRSYIVKYGLFLNRTSKIIIDFTWNVIQSIIVQCQNTSTTVRHDVQKV